MTHAIIRALWREHADAIVARSVLNCHVEGVHSIVLTEKPMLRLFVATREHQIWQNLPDSGVPLSVAFHPHHCALTLCVVHGTILNRTVEITEGDALTVFRYSSALKDGECAFTAVGKAGFIERERHLLSTSVLCPELLSLEASEVHTVGVDRDSSAAWLVMEGEEDANYMPLSYSDADLAKLDASALYQPMTRRQAMELLSLVGL